MATRTWMERSAAPLSGPEWRRQVIYVAAEPGWWAETIGAHFQDWEATEVLEGGPVAFRN